MWSVNTSQDPIKTLLLGQDCSTICSRSRNLSKFSEDFKLLKTKIARLFQDFALKLSNTCDSNINAPIFYYFSILKLFKYSKTFPRTLQSSHFQKPSQNISFKTFSKTYQDPSNTRTQDFIFYYSTTLKLFKDSKKAFRNPSYSKNLSKTFLKISTAGCLRNKT